MRHSFALFLTIFLLVWTWNDANQTVQKARCDLFEWRCDDGGCIKYEDRCDGLKNCADGSDETVEHCIHFKCPAYAFRCAYGACIPATYVCNKRKDCADGSDETEFLCDKSSTEIADIIKGNCSESESFECKPGECLDIDKRCDGHIDCSNGADEKLEACSSFPCHKLAFRCGYGACVAGISRCNGVNDCFDGSDETAELCEHKDALNVCRMPMRRDYLQVFNVNGKKIINAGDVVEYGVELRFKCAEGWKLLGAKRIFCERDGWTNPVPYCTQHCLKYLLQRGISTTAQCFLNDREISCERKIPIGTMAQLNCANGYTLDENAPTPLHQALRCNSVGKWHAEKMKCLPKCGSRKSSSSGNAYPWEVSIFRLEGSLYQKQCLGTIISPKIVLSAEKCFSQIISPRPDEHELYNIVEGKYTTAYEPQSDLKRQVYNVSEILLTSDLRTADNIAILVLVNYFDLSNNLAPACLQLKRFTTAPYRLKQSVDIEKHASTELGGGFYEVRDSIYFLTKVVGESGTIKPIDLVKFDTTIKKYIERYLNLY